MTVKQTARNVKAVGMEKIAKCYIRFVRGGMLQGGKEITGVGEGEGGKEVEREVKSVKSAARGEVGGERKLREEEKEGKRKTKGKRAERGQRKSLRKTVEGKAERRQRKSLKRMVEREMAALGRERGVADS